MLTRQPLDLAAGLEDYNAELRWIWRASMRSFLAACGVSFAIAVIAAAILNTALQEPVAKAFSTSEVRN